MGRSAGGKGAPADAKGAGAKLLGFARDLTVQLTGHDFLLKQGIALIPTTAPDYFTADTPTAVLVRQVLGAIAEFEKTSLVAKLRAARERKKAQTGNCGGRQSHAEARPEVVALVRQLRRRRPKGGQRSLREISAELAKLGHLNERGAPMRPCLSRPCCSRKQRSGAR